MGSYKPEGHPSVSAYLIADGASATIDFLVRALDAVEVMRIPSESGGILHAEVRIDDSVVMLTDGAEGSLPVASHVHVYVPDVDATYARALEAGGSAVQAPVKREDSDKRGGVRGPGGITWWFATKVD